MQSSASDPSAPARLVRIGTRGSQLARWQAEWVAGRLIQAHPGLEVELVEIATHGDRDRTSPLAAIGGMGLFTKEIQRALLDGRVDVAVHSLKDLPTQTPEGLRLAAVPAREDVADALIAPIFQTLMNLPPGATVGTSSQRRRAQVLHQRPDLDVRNIRGNVETRLNHARDGRLDAVLLAGAGLNRLGLSHAITERLSPETFLPAVGQGALGIECRLDDPATASLLAPLDDPETHPAIDAERIVLAELEGGCTIPLACWARRGRERMVLDAAVFDLDGRQKVSASAEGAWDDPKTVAFEVVRRLRELGADALLAEVRRGRG